MTEFTLLKLEVDDVSFTARAPFSGREDSETDDAEPEDGEGVSLVPLVLGLAFLVALALAVRKLRGSDGNPVEVTDETPVADVGE